MQGLPPGQHSQVGDVFGEVAWDTRQLLVGAVHDGALAAAPVRAHEVHEALAAEPAAVILRAWGAPKRGRQWQPVRHGARLWALEMGRHGAGGWPSDRGSIALIFWPPCSAFPAPQPPVRLLSLWSLSFITFHLMPQAPWALKFLWVMDLFEVPVQNLVYDLRGVLSP